MRNLLLFCGVFTFVSYAQNPAVEWTYELNKPAHAPTLFPNAHAPTGVVITSDSKAILLHGDGTPVWETPLPAPVATPATVADVDQDGMADVVLALSDGTVVCITADGVIQWSTPFNTPAGGFKNVVAADLMPNSGLEILAGFDDGWLNCLSAQGDLLWRFFGDKYRVGGIAVADVDADGAPEIVYGTDNGHIYCLDGWGRVQWRYDELAPYGRSGPNLADLDGDGKAEVLITRSNVGNATCLMALDAAGGTFLWRTRDMMQGYVSNVVVDFDSDESYEVLHGDKGNNLYADNADGTRRFEAMLGGRGLFWAPVVADVDGDGALEAVAGMRGTDRQSGACLYVVSSEGAVEAALPLGSGANAGPAVGDIDRDGELELIVCSEGPNQVQVLTWGAGGRVAWPSLRGGSAMTAATNVPAGTPEQRTDIKVVGKVTLDEDDVTWGDNIWKATWQEPVPENAFLEVSVIADHGPDETSILDLKPGATTAAVSWQLRQSQAANVVLRLHVPGEPAPRFVTHREVSPREPGFCHMEAVEQAVTAAAQAGEAAGVETAPLHTKLLLLRAEQDAVSHMAKSGAVVSAIAEEATVLRTHGDALRRQAEALEAYWRAGNGGHFVYWNDANPWDRFDPLTVPEQFGAGDPIVITAYGDEFEDAAITLLNVTTQPLDVRAVFFPPSTGQGRPTGDPELAQHVSLHRAVPVPATFREKVFDALPELDHSRTMTLPPGEARQLWLVVDTHGMEPGVHELTLYIGSLTDPPSVVSVPLRIQVWPVTLPGDVYVKMNWSNFNFGQASDQAVKDMIDHGISAIYGPPAPTIPVNAQGELAGSIDWSAFDAVLERVPRHFYMLWGGPPVRKWPEGVNPDEDSDTYLNGFKTAIHALAEHLASKGFGYDRWAFYPVDEPWNTGFSEIPHLRKFCEMVKGANPNAQNYTDPAGGVRVEYVEEFKDLIDIWQPEVNILKRDPELARWMRENARHFWVYEATSPGKDLLPLGYYRAYAWLAWYLGAEGAGYWVYRGNDVWWPIKGGDWSPVYQTNQFVVPSRRWEADRDGVEDYRALYLLREEIDKARKAGRTTDAERAQALMDEAVAEVAGWQVGTIDEITRLTRDYELDYDLLLEYRARIALELMRLKGLAG